MRGQKSQVPTPLPGLTGSPNTHLTSWGRRSWGGLGSHRRRNRLRTVLGHLREKGGYGTAAHLFGVSTGIGSSDPTSTPSCRTRGL